MEVEICKEAQLMRINQVTFFLTILAVLILCLLPETDIFAHSKSAKGETVKSSNEIFRQLFKAGAIYDEQLFTLGTKSYPSSMADNIVSPSSEILKAGNRLLHSPGRNSGYHWSSRDPGWHVTLDSGHNGRYLCIFLKPRSRAFIDGPLWDWRVRTPSSQALE